MREKLISVWEVKLTLGERISFMKNGRFSKMPAFHSSQTFDKYAGDGKERGTYSLSLVVGKAVNTYETQEFTAVSGVADALNHILQTLLQITAVKLTKNSSVFLPSIGLIVFLSRLQVKLLTCSKLTPSVVTSRPLDARHIFYPCCCRWVVVDSFLHENCPCLDTTGKSTLNISVAKSLFVFV